MRTSCGVESAANGMKDKLAKLIPDYMLPSEFKVIEKFPQNNNGKIDRNALGNLLNGK